MRPWTVEESSNYDWQVLAAVAAKGPLALIETIREGLERHHAYHFRKKGPLLHDDESCEVDDALAALSLLEATALQGATVPVPASPS